MKTNTLLKRTIRATSFLIIILVLISFKAKKPILSNFSENSKEFVMKAEYLANNITPIRDHFGMDSEDSKILLEIDTENINESNLDSTVVFINVVDGSRINSGNPKDFLTKVNKNMKVFWEGVPKDLTSNATIDILDIRRKVNIDDNARILKFSTKEKKDKKIEIKVKNRNITGYEHYEVQFRIIYADNSTKTFWVDPKLEMKI